MAVSLIHEMKTVRPVPAWYIRICSGYPKQHYRVSLVLMLLYWYHSQHPRYGLPFPCPVAGVDGGVPGLATNEAFCTGGVVFNLAACSRLLDLVGGLVAAFLLETFVGALVA